MSNKDNSTPTKRQYPPIYEKAVPIVLALIAIGFVVLLVVIFAVVLGLFPGTR